MAETVGPYELIKRLAVGGAAEIYLARKGGLLGFEQHYALKMLLPHYQDDEEHRKMMVDEARLTAQLDHPNIVKVHDLGEEDGTLFMVMEYVNGMNLAQIMARLGALDQQMPIEVAVYIAREACGGLHYAHTRQSVDGSHLRLVHRDVSPQNVLVGFGGEIKLIDFGVAKAAVGGRLETKTGIIKGKLTYMAPEYAVGSQQDHRSDVFATGLCLYEMLTGRAAYDIEDARELVEAVKKAHIARPSKARSDVPPGLEKMLEKALEERPDDRWETADELQKALSQFLSVYAPDFRKEQLARWMIELRRASNESDLAKEAAAIAEESGPATVETDDLPPTHATAHGSPALADSAPDLDALVATQSLDLEEQGLRPPSKRNRQTQLGMPLSEIEDEAAQSGAQKRSELLAGLDIPRPPRVADDDDDDVADTAILGGDDAHERDGGQDSIDDVGKTAAQRREDEESVADTAVLGPNIDIPELASGIRVKREFLDDEDVANAPTGHLDVGEIAPDRATSGSELPTATNIDVEAIRADLVQRQPQGDRPQILTQSGFQEFAKRPSPNRKTEPAGIISGVGNADPLAVTSPTSSAELPLMSTPPLPDEPSRPEPPPDEPPNPGGLPAVIVEPQDSSPSAPLEKRTPGLSPPDPDPNQANQKLSDTATALISKLNERYDEFAATESGRKTTDAIIVGALGVTLFVVLVYVFWYV